MTEIPKIGKRERKMKLKSEIKRATSILTISVLLILSFFQTIGAQPVPIGQTVQANPFESNPQADANNLGLSSTNIRDGDLSTSVQWSIGVSTNGYVNATSFESALTSFTIGWVDIKIKYSAEATTDDRYRIFYQLTGSPIVKTLQGYVSGASAKFDYNGAADERVWSKVAEPGGPGLDGVWSWTDISNLKVVVQTQQQGGSDDTNLFFLYEVWLTIYEGTYPQALSAPGPNDKYYDAGGTVAWDVGEPAIRDVNSNGVYDAGDVLLVGTEPSIGVALKVPTALNKYWDLNANKIWDVGESAIKDVNNNGIYDSGDVVLAGTAPAPPVTVSIQPPLVLGLGADSKFFVDVFVTNVANMHGFQFLIDYDERILTATDYFAYNPFILQAPSELSTAGTYLYVNKTGGFTNRIKEWNVQGTSSYLYEEDYPTNYIDTTTTDAKIGDFRFAPTRLSFETMYSKRVFLEICANQSAGGDDDVEIWLYNEGTATYVNVGTITPDSGAFSWKSTGDLQSILDTLDKINNAKVYLVKKTNGAADQIMVDAMRLRIPDTGYAAVAFSSYMGDPTGFTGSQPVVRIYFKVDADGASLLHFVKSLLTTTAGIAIVHDRNDGLFATSPVHDVAVTDVKVNATQVMPGGHIEVDLTVANQGTYTETFTVTAYYDSTAIGTPQTVTELGPGSSQVLTFDWDTSGVSVGRYLIKAEVTLASDANPGNNVKEDGWVLVGLHDIAVIDVVRAYPTPDKAIPPSVTYLNVTQGEKVYVNMTVYNNGTFPETFNATALYYSNDEPSPDRTRIIGTYASLSLNPGASLTLNYTWNTIDVKFKPPIYVPSKGWIYFNFTLCEIRANVTKVPYEKGDDYDYTNNNLFIDGWVNVTKSAHHDIAITFVEAYPLRVMPGQYVWIDVIIANEGEASETFNVSVYYDTNIIGTRTVWNLPPGGYQWLEFPWSTAGVAEGTYTISAVADVVPGETDTADNTYINGVVTVSVPRISISPTSGPVGTKVTVTGHGFPVRAGVYLTFDDQLTGLLYTDENGNLTASFNVPFSEAGTHAVKIPISYYPYTITAEATFTVIDVTPLDINVDVGAIFFKGETVELYVQTSFSGKPIDVTFLNVTLYMPDGTNQPLTTQRISIGLYKIRYTISGKGTMTGTYTLVVEASYITSTVNAYGTSIKTFIVKPTWEREAPKIAAFSIASIGLVSAMILLWRKEKDKFLKRNLK